MVDARQDGRNGCDNTVAEQTWLGGSVSNINGSGKTAAIVAARTWLKGPGGSGGSGGSGGREAAEMSRDQRRRRSKLVLAETAMWRRGNIKTAVTATTSVKIWIFGRGCGKTVSTAVTTRCRGKLGLVVTSDTEMAVEIQQQQWRRKLDL